MSALHALLDAWRLEALRDHDGLQTTPYADNMEAAQASNRTLFRCADDLAAALAETGWRSMDSAPKSTVENGRVRGVFLLGYCPDEAVDPASCLSVIWWEPLTDGGVWYGQEAIEVRPTAWMPLPPPPAEEPGR